MSQYNLLFDTQYARFQILAGHLHFGLFWSADFPKVYMLDALIKNWVHFEAAMALF